MNSLSENQNQIKKLVLKQLRTYWEESDERVIAAAIPDTLDIIKKGFVGLPNIGNNVIVSANTYIINEEIPNNCIVFGKSPNLTIKTKSAIEIKKYTKHIWGWEIEE